MEKRTSLFLGLVLWIFDPRRLFRLFFCANLSLPLKAVCLQTRMVTGFLVSFSYPTLTTCVLEKITQRGKIVLPLCAVHSIIDGDKADAFLWEQHFGVHSHLQIISP